MSKNNKKFVCIFDSSHFVDSEDKLAKHMLKCKAMEKQSYLCCQFNPLHWVKHYTIAQHQSDCPDKNKITKPVQISFSKILPHQISRYEFSQPFQIDMSMVQSSSLVSQNKTSKNQSIHSSRNDDPNLMGKKQKQQRFKKNKQTQLWVQPDIQMFLKQIGYKKGKIQTISRRNQPESFIANNDSFLF